eukprot:6440415-Prymnesium_polylepis.1
MNKKHWSAKSDAGDVRVGPRTTSQGAESDQSRARALEIRAADPLSLCLYAVESDIGRMMDRRLEAIGDGSVHHTGCQSELPPKVTQMVRKLEHDAQTAAATLHAIFVPSDNSTATGIVYPDRRNNPQRKAVVR